MDSDFSECVVLNARMAARAVSRRYDKWLRQFGVTAAQFTLLAGLSAWEEGSVTEFAEKLALDRTTASRNLDVLERKGLVQSRDGDSGNKRLCSLTDEGRSLLRQLVPRWHAAQVELRATLGNAEFRTTIETLQSIARL